ncbi:hypothetical protein CS022_22545 [Veronia nyctiphanis]|uniref:Zeta toxin domain-containing protein n=1 Tax=Veronia nyctiphanis TaxID=1278244 RepID=A0A4Q0YMV7_9GAMM|nr:zeta toxin family protein [Veronia nyctiphanis]RXJ70649.1 hypothetical protein CS022_22545 [Veronia nyctiphanis]
MKKNYNRPLHNNQLAFDFISRVLNKPDTVELGNNIQKIVTAEKLLQSTTTEPTLTSMVNRHTSYATDNKRVELREQIFSELAFKERLDNDDEIELGKGGCLPKSGVKNEGKAFIVTGLPASGKSNVASKVADHFNAAIIDSDYAKRKFPEYPLPQGASVVHDESNLVAFGGDPEDGNFDDEPSLYEYLIKDRTNIVIPKIGHDQDSVLGLRDKLLNNSAANYDEVHLILVSVDRVISTDRALNRFINTERYVPLSLVFDVYSNEPTLTYYRVKDCEKWTSTCKLKTNGEEPVCVASNGDNCPSVIFKGENDDR